MMKQLTKEQAIALGESEAWKDLTVEQRAKTQMVTERLFMPFAVFHEAIEKTLGRPVFTHEFGLNRDGLMAELFDGAPAPSLDEIIEMIPEDKRIVLAIDPPRQRAEHGDDEEPKR